MHDWNKLARGRPATSMIQDQEARKAMEANNQNIEFLVRKVQKIRKRPDDYKFPIDDISKRPQGHRKNKDPLWPACVMASCVWVSPTSGTITGIIHPNGYTTTYYFRYMAVAYNTTTKKYPDANFASSSQTTLKTIASTALSTSVSETITGLTVPSRYYVQIVANNSMGISFSDIMSFDTGQIPSVTLGATTAITTTAATLNANVNPNGLATTLYFDWGITYDCGTTTAVQDIGAGISGVPVTAALTGLVTNTLYYFRVIATNTCGTTTSSFTSFRTI